MDISIETIIAENDVFTDKNPKIEPLQGGLVNGAYKVICEDKTFFVRINGRQSDYLLLDRALEVDANKIAGELGISPIVYDAKRKSDYLITDFSDGRMPGYGELFHEDNIKKFTDILKVIHSQIHVTRKCSTFDVIDGFMRVAFEKKVALPDGVSMILNKVGQIRAQRSNDTVYSNVFCHGDFWANNILISDTEMVVVDWELCGYGAAYFDLCHLVKIGDTPESVEKLILKSYFGYYEEEMLHTLQQMKYAGMALEMAWAFFHLSVPDPVADQGVDYNGFGNQVAELLLSGKNHF